MFKQIQKLNISSLLDIYGPLELYRYYTEKRKNMYVDHTFILC